MLGSYLWLTFLPTDVTISISSAGPVQLLDCGQQRTSTDIGSQLVAIATTDVCPKSRSTEEVVSQSRSADLGTGTAANTSDSTHQPRNHDMPVLRARYEFRGQELQRLLA